MPPDIEIGILTMEVCAAHNSKESISKLAIGQAKFVTMIFEKASCSSSIPAGQAKLSNGNTSALNWMTPVSHDPVGIWKSQQIGAILTSQAPINSSPSCPSSV